MTKKRLALFILSSFIYFTGVSLDRSKKFELIIQQNQATERGDVTIDVYNGYELVMSRSINKNQPTPIYLNLYCNYILIIKERDRELIKYHISTEVPTRIKKEWKMTINIPNTNSNSTDIFAEVREGNISYQDDGRKFNLVLSHNPMAEKTSITQKK